MVSSVVIVVMVIIVVVDEEISLSLISHVVTTAISHISIPLISPSLSKFPYPLFLCLRVAKPGVLLFVVCSELVGWLGGGRDFV